MKTKIFAACGGIATALLAIGCVSTVSGTHTAGWPATDSVVGRYQRPIDDVYNAAIQVVNNNGVLEEEYIPHDTTNSVRSIRARIDKDTVYMRVESIDPQITQVTVQARTTFGGDFQEAHELDKEIALQLARQ